MARTSAAVRSEHDLITPNWRQEAREVQKFGTVIPNLPIGLSHDVRQEMAEKLNLLLADTATIRDLYKKCHWQVSGPTFYQLHLLFDKHYEEQSKLIDLIAERIQMLGGVSVAMAHDVAEMTRLERPPRGREEVPAQISRLLEAHHSILDNAHQLAKRANDLGDDGTNDMIIGDVIRTHEMQAWFVSQHLVDMPLVHAM